MPVVVADEVWRCTVRSPYLDDLGRLIGPADNPSMYMQAITYHCVHGPPLPRVVQQHAPWSRRSEEARTISALDPDPERRRPLKSSSPKAQPYRTVSPVSDRPGYRFGYVHHSAVALMCLPTGEHRRTRATQPSAFSD